ncbi:hypothetical protein GCM10027449_14700 [Sinomonas notoginsengisoli]|uniref:hypothetical protein n=1 Tax=Sinomonas notoginsengisoli TaxID=1457311 RepID=UPI001F26B31A|nr:hypothetical protein [Sinomonas notoginsengisoli]
MVTLELLIAAAAIILAALCLANALAIHIGRLRARRAADAAVDRLHDRYRDALRKMGRCQ